MFNEAFEIIIGHEGGYVNDSTDRGGETKYGISKKAYPDIDIKKLTLDKAKEIYYNDYWLAAKIHLLPEHLQISVFDSVVNHGIRGGIRILQKSLGLKTDGIVGTNTINASEDLDEALFLFYRLNYYIDIVVARPSQLKFINGWRNRIVELLNDEY